MAWDSSRPVPWERLMKEWVLYAAIMTALFLLLFRDSNIVGAIAGVLISGPLYLALGALLAKFGYTRRTMKQLRGERKDDSSGSGSESGGDTAEGGGSERKPPPTRRTSGGSNRPTPKQKRR